MNDLTKLIKSTDSDFEQKLDQAMACDEFLDDAIEHQVKEILSDVKSRGDRALLDFTARFDCHHVSSVGELELTPIQTKRALDQLDGSERAALDEAAQRIYEYHERQQQDSWHYTDAHGNILGQQIMPMDKVGVYVPGGKASYPSSVLMNTIPAKVAGVGEITMMTPAFEGAVNPLVLAAASLAGVDRVFTVGGAQAIAALAYGTETIASVDKIVGPGNVYVAMAKRLVFGVVGIDMIAGPSEILIYCDGKTPIEWIVKDMFSQAEHDESAQAILISTDLTFLQQVQAAIPNLLSEQPRKAIIAESLKRRGLLLHVASEQQAIALINTIAAEHLELSVENPEELLPQIRHAGAIFVGRYTAEALGDYCAGPNHVLPTSGTARFASPLGVYDFQKRSSIIQCSAEGAKVLGATASRLARSESLIAHAESAEARM